MLIPSRYRTEAADQAKAQETKITRIPPEQWRRVKKGRRINLGQSVLLVSSVANASTNMRKKKLASTLRKAGARSQAVEEPGSLDIPYRLAINSRYLLSAIGECIGEQITEAQNVIVRPFKHLVTYEAEIRQFFSDLESTYEQAEADLEAHVASKNDMAPDTQSHDAKEKNLREVADRAKRERDELRCLLEFMDRDMADIFDVKRQISEKTLKEISFEHLWQLFWPGQIIYQFKTQDDASRCQAYQILHVTGGRVAFDFGFKAIFDPVAARKWDGDSETEERNREMVTSTKDENTSFIIDCFCIDFDGVRIGPKSKRFVMPRYAGTRPLELLSLYPAFLHPNNHQIQESLLARGRKFTELAMGTHKRYDGQTIRESNYTHPGVHIRGGYRNYVIPDAELHCEVIVDQATGIEQLQKKMVQFSLRLGGGILFNPTLVDRREIFDPLPEKLDKNWVTDVFDDSKFESDRYTDFLQSTDLLGFHDLERAGCSEEHALLLPPRVYGYSLLEHKWLALDLNRLSEIPPRSLTAHFEDLVLPDGHKMLLEALVKNHVRPPHQHGELRETFSMDLVAGKGKGLVILLHGVPGVGKTSTAECVAAELGRPLLPITCGDIGTTAKEAERSLESFCGLAQKWRCVLLLDEADVFLAKREKGDIHRNSLVSVFLRVLEYYSGVIILTTNRVGEFDEAFRSRIHISLYYPKLSHKSTKEIWQRNITRLRDSGIDMDIEEDKIGRFIDRLWERNQSRPSRLWNGRQMKNAFQTAIALANWDFHEGGGRAELERPLLKASHFIRVAQTSAHFDDYIRDIHGFEDEDDPYSIIAGRDELRQDRNMGSFPDPAVSRGGRSVGRNPLARTDVFGKRQVRRGDFDDLLTGDEDDGEGDDLERMELELKLARLKKKKGLGKAGTTRQTMGEDDDGAW
ncbi:hypothetical protein QBC40DRAFT_75026 [Triangularia verruculosa]|uniref:AAA+ ATPase domain-containing protein n=1 Tax=Triangularia verruculosa TaxID=2587418 RepID=A0AAN6XQZ5_9PEZI|nr:hypothetical protein QBC40DRAFT_75026 [Triangularia verruculosa]